MAMGGMVGLGVVGGGLGIGVGAGGNVSIDLANIYSQRGGVSSLLSAPQATSEEQWKQQQQMLFEDKVMIMEKSSENKEDQDDKKKGNLVLGLPSNTCQDCGNQAKKDCFHMRCRTCCKSRGFDCPTHVKSTWVPAARRRERQQHQEEGTRRNVPTKRQRPAGIIPDAAPPPHSVAAQVLTVKESLPAEVRGQAVFKCVKVTAMEDGEDEYAYQATVKIGGHIFKGVLHDQGLDTSIGPSSFADHQLGGRSMASTSAMVDPAQMYGASSSAFLGG